MSYLRNILAQGFYDRVQLAVIAEVDATQGFVTVIFIDQSTIRYRVPIPVVAMSQDSWIRYIPQINDIVVVGFRPDDSIAILAWQPFQYGNRVTSFDRNETNAVGLDDVPEMGQQLKPGEIDLRSKGGGYIRLTDTGDVLIMSRAGQLYLQGQEGFNEFHQLGIKVSDGKSHFRFGAPFRAYEQLSVREIPASGGGQPLAAPPVMRERDTRIYDASGNLLVQESLGVISDEDGVFEVSGTTGGGALQQAKSLLKRTIPPANAVTEYATQMPDIAQLSTSILESSIDHVKERVAQIGTSIKSAIQSVITNIQTVYANLGKISQFQTIADIVSGVQDLASDVGSLTSGMGDVQGLGEIGKGVRYRLVVNKDGNQVAAYDIDENGGIVSSTESPSGMVYNANVGGMLFYAKKGIRWVAKGLSAISEQLSVTADTNIQLIAGTSIARSAGTDILDSAQNVTITANQESAIGGGTSVKINVDTTTIQVTSSGVTITTPGTVTVTGNTIMATGNVVQASGSTISVAGGVVSITGTAITIG